MVSYSMNVSYDHAAWLHIRGIPPPPGEKSKPTDRYPQISNNSFWIFFKNMEKRKSYKKNGERFFPKFCFQVIYPYALPRNHENKQGCVFFHAESNGGVHFTEIKELEPIFRNPSSPDITRSVPSGGEKQFL